MWSVWRKRTVPEGFQHLQGDRDAAYAQIASVAFRDGTILDIGSALGDVIFRSERLGASRHLGIEMMPKRFEASTAIRLALSSKAELLHRAFVCDSAASVMNVVFRCPGGCNISLGESAHIL